MRLEAILHEDMPSGVLPEGTPKSLIASLQLSLERLTGEERHAVRLLEDYQGTLFEDNLLAITKLGDNDEERAKLGVKRIAALESGDPRAILRIAGIDLTFILRSPRNCWLSFRMLPGLQRSPMSFAPN